MFGSAALETAIGLITIYLMLSLVCSVINEAIAGRTNRRGKFLAMGIARLLGEEVKSGRGGGIDALLDRKGTSTHEFFNDRRIRALCQNEKRLPSYIPPEITGAVLLDMATAPVVPATGTSTEPSEAPSDDPSKALSPGARLAAALRIVNVDRNARLHRLLADAVERAASQPPRLLDEEPVVAAARIESALGDAFNDTMARVGGWYRRRTQIVLVVIGCCVAGAINADSIVLVNHLSVNDAAREALVQIAEAQVASEANAAGTTPGDSAGGEASAPSTQAEDAARARELLEASRGIGLPLGWQLEPSRGWSSENWALMSLSKTAGLLITITAIALGAPFWFDILQKLVSLRSAGGRPATDGTSSAADEPSKGGAPPAVRAVPVGPGGATAILVDPVSATRSGALPSLYWSALVEAGAWPMFANDTDPARLHLRMAQLSWVVYRDARSAESMLERMGFTDVTSFSSAGTQAIVARLGKDVVVAYRGTETNELADLVADARILLVDAPSPFGGGRIHSGFLGALLAVQKDVDRAIEKLRAGAPDGRLWFTGHSLGGALASLHFGCRLEPGKPNAQLRLCTVGAPRVGDGAFTRMIEARLGKAVAWRIAMERDPVPLVPPVSGGYRHFGALTTFSVAGVAGTGEGWRALLETMLDAVEDLRRAGAESLRRHALDTYVVALDRAAEAKGV